MSDLISRQDAIDDWKNDFRGYVNALDLLRDDYNGIMEYIDELPSIDAVPTDSISRIEKELHGKERIMNKLEPCPFCGGEAEKRIAPLMKTVMFVCNKCGADVCFYGAEHEPKATIAWNRRAERKEE